MEEQFYLALPLILALVPRRFLPHILAAMVTAQFFIPRPVWSLFWVLRTDALLLGVLIALFERSSFYTLVAPGFMRKRRVAIPVFGVLLFLLIEVPSNLSGKAEIAPFSTGLTALIAAATVLLASYNQNVVARAGFLKPILMWLGSRSYAIYLIHAFCIGLTAQIWAWLEPAGTVFGPNYTLRFLLTFVGLTLALAEINYRFVETPLRQRGRQVAGRISKRSENPEAWRRQVKTVQET